jgi:lysophospholipid acyltransferase (LPLAT)-like uncharacterized protein
MKLRNPWLIRVLSLLGAWVIRCWMSTVRRRFLLHDRRDYPTGDLQAGRYIYAFWHEGMLFLASVPWKSTIHVLISQHADGELISQICRRLGFKIVRGSTTRGGMQATRELLRLSERSHLAVTPDGPRGPRRRVQPGLIYLASRTGLPILPTGIGYQHPWRAKSWDRFAVPRPWTSACCATAPAIHVPPDLDRQELEHYRQQVEEALLKATAMAEKQAEGIRD